jgi:protein-tyrosine phosphatase
MWNLIKKTIPKTAKSAIKRGLRNVLDSVRLRLSPTTPFPERVHQIVFVCKGNICRSAFAEHYFMMLPGLSVRVESCGLDPTQGTVPPAEAIQAAGLLGVDLSSHCSKGLGDCDILSADLILPMEFSQYRQLVLLFPEKVGNIHLLRKFVPGISGLFCNIDDPYSRPLKDFESCFILMKKALNRLEVQLSGDAADMVRG